MNLGGEQSGHMVLSDFATTGDGLVAALQVLSVLVERARPASEVCRMFEPFPQKLRNERFRGVSPLRDAGVIEARRWAEDLLGSSGRLLLRESGTEPLVRVMAEAEDAALVDQVVEGLCTAIRRVSLAA